MGRPPPVVNLGRRVLLVDDQAEIREGIRRFLSQRYPDVDIDEAESAEDALEVARRDSEAGKPFDVVVSDFRMRVMTGIELLQRLALDSPSQRRILMSGDAVAEDLARGDRSVTKFLAKPFGMEDLDRAIGFETSA